MRTFIRLDSGRIAVSLAAIVGLFAVGGVWFHSIQGEAQTSAPRDARAANLEARALSLSRVRLIGRALRDYCIANELRYPSAAIRKGGKPLLSWRVALLPFLDQKALYEKFRLDEPWDSPHNRALLKEMPDVYAPAVRKVNPEHSTYYQGFVGPGAFFDGDEGIKIERLTDGPSGILVIVEAEKPVPWTKPEDIPFDKAKPMPKVGGLFENGFHAIFADSSVGFLSKAKVVPLILRALVTIDGGEVVVLDELWP